MRLTEVENKAKSMGVKDTWKYPKKDLIQLIQRVEGNSSCFATPARISCGQGNCLWRSDCLK